MFKVVLLVAAVFVVILVLFRKSLKPFLRFLVSKLFLINLLLAILTLSAVSFFTFNNIESYARNDSENYQKYYLEVPDFKGVHVDQIEEFIGDRPFRFVISDSVYSDEAPAGTVLRQDPLAHSTAKPSLVKPDRRIYLTVVKQAGEYREIPDLVASNNSKVIAKRRLEALGFIARLTPEAHKHDGIVIRLQYKGKALTPGTKLLKGAVVEVIYGSGEGGAPVPLPDLRGKRIIDASQELALLGLESLLICDDCLTQEDSLNFKIVKQIPDLKSVLEGIVEAGTIVTIYASKSVADSTGM